MKRFKIIFTFLFILSAVLALGLITEHRAITGYYFHPSKYIVIIPLYVFYHMLLGSWLVYLVTKKWVIKKEKVLPYILKQSIFYILFIVISLANYTLIKRAFPPESTHSISINEDLTVYVYESHSSSLASFIIPTTAKSIHLYESWNLFSKRIAILNDYCTSDYDLNYSLLSMFKNTMLVISDINTKFKKAPPKSSEDLLQTYLHNKELKKTLKDIRTCYPYSLNDNQFILFGKYKYLQLDIKTKKYLIKGMRPHH